MGRLTPAALLSGSRAVMAAGAAVVVGGAAGGAAGAETSALKVPTVLSFLRPMPATDPNPNPDCGDSQP